MYDKYKVVFKIWFVLVLVLSSCEAPLNPDYTNKYDPKSLNFEPDRPTSVYIGTDGQTRIITWRDNSDFETGYAIERRNSTTLKYINIGQTGPNCTAYEDTSGISIDSLYYYRIVCISEHGKTTSDPIAFTFNHVWPIINNSLIMSVNCLTKNSVIIYWLHGINYVNGFRVGMSANNGPFREIASLPQQTTSYIVSDLDNSSKYAFKVYGVTSNYKMECSDTVSISYINGINKLYDINTDYFANSIAISKNGNFLTSGGRNLDVYNVSDGKIIVNFPPMYHTNIKSIQFSPDSKKLAYCADGYMWVHSLETLTFGSFTDDNKYHQTVYNTMHYSPTGDTIISLTNKSFIQLWSSQGQFFKSIQGVDSEFIDLSPDGKYVSNGNLIIRISDGQTVHTFPSYANNMVFSPDGNSVAFVGTNNCFQVWDINNESLTIDQQNVLYYPFLSFDIKGDRIALCSTAGSIDIRDAHAGSILYSLNCNAMYPVFSPLNNVLAAASSKGNVSVFSLGEFWKVEKP